MVPEPFFKLFREGMLLVTAAVGFGLSAPAFVAGAAPEGACLGGLEW